MNRKTLISDTGLFLLPFFLVPSFLFSIFLGGCESEGQPGPGVSVRDSAGVSIVENSGELDPEGGGWSVASDPTLSIGTFQGEPEDQLFQVQGASRLPDGRVAVANAGSGEIKVFDAGGQFLLAHGRKGEGPGEFERPVIVGSSGRDTLVVVDNQLRRISWIHPDEGFLGSVPISSDLGGGAYPQGMFADGTVILGGGFYWSSDSGVELTSGYSRRATSFWSVAPDGHLVTDFGQFPGAEFFMLVTDEGGGAISMRARLIPFGKHSMQAVGSDHFFVASGDAWEISALGPDGGVRKLIRFLRDPLPVRSEDLEAVIQEEIDEAGDPSSAQEIRAEFQDMPVPDLMPAFAGLHVDVHGFLWVEEYRRPGDETPRFDILDPTGRWVGRVSLPPGFEILEIGDDHLLCLFRDELEVEYVKLLSLQRGTS
jgi:hypothetical protein